MIFRSKMIRNPNFPLPGNKMGRTVGLVFHTPKFWSCKKRKLQTEPHASFPDWYTELQREQAAAHENCGWPNLHLSYRGYLYWVGPKRRYQLHYMGNINKHNPRLNSFGYVQKHHDYVRWFDNGSHPETLDTEERQDMLELLNAATAQHLDNGCLFMSHKFAECICSSKEEQA